MVSRIMTYDSELPAPIPFRLALSPLEPPRSVPQSHESVHSGGVPASDSLDHLVSKGWRTVVCR